MNIDNPFTIHHSAFCISFGGSPCLRVSVVRWVFRRVARSGAIRYGERFETYAIPGPAKSGVICINGSAARKCQRGDLMIIAAFVLTDEPVTPKLALVNQRNEFIAYA